MDLLVIVSQSRQKPIQRAVRAQRSLRGVKAPVDVLVRTRKEFERYFPVKASLEGQITREGKLLYGRKAPLARKWLTKARRDLFSAKRLARGSEPYLDTAFYTESGHKLRVKVWKKQTLVRLKT